MPFPRHRMRRLRRTEGMRSLVRESRLTPNELIYPIFVCAGRGVRSEIRSMPGQYNLSVDMAVETAKQAERFGIGGLLLFGIPEAKDSVGSGAYAEDGIVQRALRAIRESVDDLILVADVCLCEYTDHGPCGVVSQGRIENDPTLELLAKTALSQAAAGADVVAPSDMMDGRVGVIREELDAAGLVEVPIMSYAAKYASAFYGPFREAAGSTPQFGDRRSHQMDPANVREALREIELDIEEGADIVMVKPAMPYLDVVSRARKKFTTPIAAYQVSGEYAMIEAAAANGWLERERSILESVTAIKRAGADIVLTYYALELAEMLG
jgi:porphobilinogen synthase